MVADCKEFLNPGATDRWSGSQFHYLHGIQVNQKLHFQFKRDSLGRVVMRSKSTAQDLAWSKPFYMVKHQAKAELDLKTFPPSAVKRQPKEALEKILEGLESCKSRLSEAEYQSLLLEYEKIANVTPVPFHWADGGLFRYQMILNDRSKVCLFQFIRLMCVLT